MKNFAIFLGFVLLCSSVAFAVDEQQLNYEHLWLGQWCTGWTSGDSEQMGYPIQLNFTLNKDGIITGDDVHDSITTNYYDIKVDRDKMNGSWKQQGTDFEGVFNITLKYDEKKNKIFDGTWKDTKRPYGHGAYRGKKTN